MSTTYTTLAMVCMLAIGVGAGYMTGPGFLAVSGRLGGGADDQGVPCMRQALCVRAMYPLVSNPPMQSEGGPCGPLRRP